MTGVAFALFVFAVAVMVFVHWRTQKRLEALEAARIAEDQARQHALYKQNKDMTKRLAAAERATAKLVDQTRNAVEDARLMNERADRMLKEARRG